MDKKVIIVLTLLLSTAVIAAYVRGNFARAVVGEAQVRIAETTYRVEVADTIATRAHGLSGRDGLAPGSGMLFVFKPASVQSFWMHGMRFPIDIIWIRDGVVQGVAEGAQVPTRFSTPTFASPGPVEYVLELAAGTAKRDGIRAGVPVEIRGHGN